MIVTLVLRIIVIPYAFNADIPIFLQEYLVMMEIYVQKVINVWMGTVKEQQRIVTTVIHVRMIHAIQI